MKLLLFPWNLTARTEEKYLAAAPMTVGAAGGGMAAATGSETVAHEHLNSGEIH